MKRSAPKEKPLRAADGGLLDPKIDHGVRPYVEVLNAAGIETYESCQGGRGHAYPEPTIRFHGERSEGFRALAVARQHNFPVAALRRAWSIADGEPVGPHWEMTFSRTADAMGYAREQWDEIVRHLLLARGVTCPAG